MGVRLTVPITASCPHAAFRLFQNRNRAAVALVAVVRRLSLSPTTLGTVGTCQCRQWPDYSSHTPIASGHTTEPL